MLVDNTNNVVLPLYLLFYFSICRIDYPQTTTLIIYPYLHAPCFMFPLVKLIIHRQFLS